MSKSVILNARRTERPYDIEQVQEPSWRVLRKDYSKFTGPHAPFLTLWSPSFPDLGFVTLLSWKRCKGQRNVVCIS